MTEEEKLRAAWNIHDACEWRDMPRVIAEMDRLIDEVRSDAIADSIGGAM